MTGETINKTMKDAFAKRLDVTVPRAS